MLQAAVALDLQNSGKRGAGRPPGAGSPATTGNNLSNVIEFAAALCFVLPPGPRPMIVQTYLTGKIMIDSLIYIRKMIFSKGFAC